MDKLKVILLKHCSGRDAVVIASSIDEALSLQHQADPGRYWPDAKAHVVSHSVGAAFDAPSILLNGPTYRDV